MSVYLIPLGTRLDNLVGLLSELDHARTLQPNVSGVQQMHTVTGVDSLAAYKTQCGCICGIDTLEFE